jgi:3-hydroxyisobutyrate dehydrogenase-like beta-hydroxyacid dehydrogenase
VSQSERVGVVGLGAMGSQIAAALIEAGHALVVFDERREAMAPLVKRGATACDSLLDVANAAQVVLASLAIPEVVRVVACGDGGLIEGTAIKTFVDLSTTGAIVAEEVAAAMTAAGVGYVDAPVSGGIAGAKARTLTVMASGRSEEFARVRPLLETFAKKIFLVGDLPGQGQTAKLLNNLLSATAMAITSEAMTVGVRAGLEPATLLEIFNAGSGRNTATADKFPTHVITRRFAAGFRLQLMAKDVELCLSEARRRRVPMLLGSLVGQLWALGAALGDEADDHTEIVRLFERWAGVEVIGSPGAPHAGG